MAYTPIPFPKMLYHPKTKEPLIVHNVHELGRAVQSLGYTFTPAIVPHHGETHPTVLHPFDVVMDWAGQPSSYPREWTVDVEKAYQQVCAAGLQDLLPPTAKEKLCAQKNHIQTEVDRIQEQQRVEREKGHTMSMMRELECEAMCMDELMLSLALIELTVAQYSAHDMVQPRWVVKRKKALEADIKRRLADDLAQAEAELEALKEKEDRRQELRAKIEALKTKVGE